VQQSANLSGLAFYRYEIVNVDTHIETDIIDDDLSVQ